MQANNQALLSLTGLAPDDVLKAEWSASDFRPCHYVAIDRRRRRIVIGVRGSLEVSDLYTDFTAAPVAWEFDGVKGFVHEGLLSAAAYVHASTADALAEAARRCPGWPVLLTGARSGGGPGRLGEGRAPAHLQACWLPGSRGDESFDWALAAAGALTCVPPPVPAAGAAFGNTKVNAR